MDPIEQQLNSELDAVITEVETLATKSDEASATAMKAAQTKMLGIKTRIEALTEARGVKAWQNEVPATARDTTAVKTAVVVGEGGPVTATKASVGTTEIDLMTGKVVMEAGAGILTSQQFKATTNPDYVAGFDSYLRSGGNVGKMKGTKAATDAFREGVDSEGGHFVPPEVIAGVLRRSPARTRVVDLVRTIGLSKANKAQWVRSLYDSDDLYSSAMRIYKHGEAEAARKSPKPQFGLKSIDVHGWMAEISISKEMRQDGNFDIMGYFAEEFRTAQRNMVAQKILLGSGIGEHFGIITRAGQAKDGVEIIKSGDANLLTWDSLRKIKNAIPEQYDENCQYLFNKKSGLDTIEGFKDADNRDLWPEAQRAGGIEGAPGRLRGYGYSLEAFMPDIVANAIAILFGDFMGYARVLRSGMTIQVLDQIEARNGQDVFLVDFREGGDLIEPWRLRALQIKA